MMMIEYSDAFREGVLRLSPEAKRQLKKKLELMLENPRHPSLRSKKIQGIDGIFEASANMNIRMTWQYTDDGILLRKIGEHENTIEYIKASMRYEAVWYLPESETLFNEIIQFTRMFINNMEIQLYLK